MGSWLERSARRLAEADSASVAPGATERSPGLTRRDTMQIAAGAGLAIGTMRTFGPSVPDARAEDYCLPKCLSQAAGKLSGELDSIRGRVLSSYATTLSPLLRLGTVAAAGASIVDSWGDYYTARSRCRGPACGNPATYPPPSGGGTGSPGSGNPPGCGNDAKYVACGDQPCCNLTYADCVTCNRGPVCCRHGGNCCG